MNQNDKQLVADYLDGDDTAFEKLLKQYLKPIYNFLYQFTSNVTQTEDLTQETFIKAWKNIHKYDQAKSFKTWLFTIAKNTALDYLKKRKTISFSFFEDANGNNKLEEIPTEALLMDELIEQKDLVNKLETKLEQIPEQYRIILKLRYKEDFTLNEIAKILDKPYNTIKVYHQRALKELKTSFLNE